VLLISWAIEALAWRAWEFLNLATKSGG